MRRRDREGVLAVVALSFAFVLLAKGPGSLLHPWMSTFRWAILVVWFSSTVVLSLRMWRLGREVDAPR